jgi:nicotinate-nucleotide adenylyltransferase
MSPITHVQRVGLLGGSFNPAHEGHLHISLLALKSLKLDELWWLVSPGNPLKSKLGMASLEDRLKTAKKISACNPDIVVSDIENSLSTCHTVDTIESLKAEFPEVSFVWIMGADLLVQVPQWKRWRALFKMVPIAVFARPAYSARVLSGKAARHFKGARVARYRIGSLAKMRPPAWAYVRTRLNSQSATSIRAKDGQGT